MMKTESERLLKEKVAVEAAGPGEKGEDYSVREEAATVTAICSAMTMAIALTTGPHNRIEVQTMERTARCEE